MHYMEFKEKVERTGLLANDNGGDGWQIMGGKNLVTWFPKSRYQTIYVRGRKKEAKLFGPFETALKAASYDPDEVPSIKEHAIRTYRKARKRLLASDPHCAWCQVELDQGSATVDFRTPIAQGGKDHPTNVVLCCLNCKADRPGPGPGYRWMMH